MLNTNTEVFRIHDMNTLNKIGDLKYNGKYFMYLFYYKKSIFYYKKIFFIIKKYRI